MRSAQTLYEAGHITYMRTDSTNLSAEAHQHGARLHRARIRQAISAGKPNTYSSSNKSCPGSPRSDPPDRCDFHAASTPREKLGADEYKLYQLIWNRFVACQMPPAEFDQTTVMIAAPTKAGRCGLPSHRPKARLRRIHESRPASAAKSSLLPDLSEGPGRRSDRDLMPTQHFTQPPPRFTEASLVKELEELGIGRPSTYASIIQTIQDREYVMQQRPPLLRDDARHGRHRQADPGASPRSWTCSSPPAWN